MEPLLSVYPDGSANKIPVAASPTPSANAAQQVINQAIGTNQT
jgi:hypothetical protein